MRKVIILLTILMTHRVWAQEPSDDAKKQSTEKAAEGEGSGENGRVEESEDPTQHFNFTNFSYRGKDEYGGPFGDSVETDKQGHVLHEEEPMSPPFVFMLINFGLLLVILAKWGAPAASKLAQDRHDQIKSALDEAAKLRDQAKAKLAEYETRIKDVDTEVAKLMAGIRADADADKARILEAARVAAEHMKRDAETRIAAEIELARAQLTREIAVAAAVATEKLLRDKTTAADQHGLVSTFIASIDATGQNQKEIR